jgi:amidase
VLTPGGSSSGPGISVSANLVTIAIGTETSGSILSPSDANSDVGVKTTLGLASRAGILPLSPSFDVPGPIVRNVTDAAIVLGAIAGPDPADPATASSQPSDYLRALRPGALEGTRLGYSQDSYDGLATDQQKLFDAGIARLERLGATVVPVRSLEAQDAGISELAFIPNEFKASLDAFLADYEPTAKSHSLDDVVAYAQAHSDKYPYGDSLLQASDLTPGRSELYPSAEAVHQTAKGDIEAALAEASADAIITPGPAQANIGAAAGYPTVMTQLGYTDAGRTPMGLGFLGRPYSEAKLLSYAYDYEQDAHARVPPTDVDAPLVAAACGG